MLLFFPPLELLVLYALHAVEWRLRLAQIISLYVYKGSSSLRASSPIWASEASLARTREQAAKPPGAGERPPLSRVLARLTSLTQIGELRACSQAREAGADPGFF